MRAAAERDPIGEARALVREGVRRFGLPFGVVGKMRAQADALAWRRYTDARVIVVQDAAILYPPELIFGIDPGDCLCVQTDLIANPSAALASVEYLVSRFDPALILVAAASTQERMAEAPVRRAIRAIKLGSALVQQRILEERLAVDGCVVDIPARSVHFFSATGAKARRRVPCDL